MDEKIKDKDAEKAKSPPSELNVGLEDTFPASDPISTVQPGSAPKPEEETSRR